MLVTDAALVLMLILQPCRSIFISKQVSELIKIALEHKQSGAHAVKFNMEACYLLLFTLKG